MRRHHGSLARGVRQLRDDRVARRGRIFQNDVVVAIVLVRDIGHASNGLEGAILLRELSAIRKAAAVGGQRVQVANGHPGYLGKVDLTRVPIREGFYEPPLNATRESQDRPRRSDRH